MTVQNTHFVPDFWPDEGSSPFLDSKETSVPSDDSNSFRAFLVSGMPEKIARARAIYERYDLECGKRTAAAYDSCRSSAWFLRHKETHEIKVASSRCNLRWCPLCIRTKRFIITGSVKIWLKTLKKPKFLTLTLKHSTAPLAHQIDSIYNFFRSFRRRPYVKKRLKGGIWFFQVKLSKTDGLWHPHIHVLLDSAYIPRQELSDIWLSVTGNSPVIDIRAVKSADKAAEYVARYATAPCELDSLDPDSAYDVFKALHGRRICGTFGTARGAKLSPQAIKNGDEWENLGSFWLIATFCDRNTDYAEIFQCWQDDRPCHITLPDPPAPEVPDIHKFEEPQGFNATQMTFDFRKG